MVAVKGDFGAAPHHFLQLILFGKFFRENTRKLKLRAQAAVHQAKDGIELAAEEADLVDEIGTHEIA